MKENIDWEQVAAEQSEIIAGLSNLCASCIQELARYRAIEKEEEKFEELSGEDDNM